MATWHALAQNGAFTNAINQLVFEVQRGAAAPYGAEWLKFMSGALNEILWPPENILLKCLSPNLLKFRAIFSSFTWYEASQNEIFTLSCYMWW